MEELRSLVPSGATLAQLALRWITMFPEVSCAIPGAKNPAQVEQNVAAADLPPLDPAVMATVAAIYDHHLRALVHPLW